MAFRALRTAITGRRLRWAALGTLIAAHQYDTHFCYARVNRAVRTVFTAAATIIDYKIVLDWYPERLSELHRRVATRWYNTCAKNGGLYIKLGQSISIMNHVLPPEYLELFANLQDQAPSVPFAEIEQVFVRDFGRKLSQVFVEFDEEPIASASVAQVHRAVLADGTQVAVKLQKPQIEYQLSWDLACYRLLAFVFEKAFELPIYWSVDSTCESLTREIDFKIEAMNMERAARDLAGFSDIYIPKLHHDLSAQHVLTMEWIDGVKLSNLNAIEKFGFKPADVITTTISAFSHQIFVSGFVHGDPHPGNVFVRPNPEAPSKYQVVLLDHGLYMEESEEFRKQYCSFWKSIFLLDLSELKSICESWGVADHELFASMQMFKPFNPKNRAVHAHRTTREDVVRLQQRAKERVRELLRDTNLLPRELIILGRSMNIIRSNNKMMGSPVNRVNIMVEYAARGFSADKTKVTSLDKHVNAHISVKELVSLAMFRVRLWVLSAIYHLVQFRRYCYNALGIQSENFEEIIEQNMSRNMEERFGLKMTFE
eukprot:m.177494 g.177494  ORF g.177494 m.177494 type:complete len:541 (-) comp10438_c1_seq2:1159-2781(-)